MNKRNLKSILLPVLVLVAVSIFMSSCQRGYGCPGAYHTKMSGRR